MGVQERAQARHLPGDPSCSVQGQPLILKLEVMGLALGYTTLVVKMVNPVRAYDHWWVSFISHPPQMEGQALDTGYQPFMKNASGEDMGALGQVTCTFTINNQPFTQSSIVCRHMQ